MQVNLTMLQQIAAETHRENITLARIARQGQDDAKGVRTLTLIATIYLPASLVATIFSSNLIQWRPDTSTSDDIQKSQFVVVPQFWVYVLITLALTFLTLGCARLLKKASSSTLI